MTYTKFQRMRRPCQLRQRRRRIGLARRWVQTWRQGDQDSCQDRVTKAQENTVNHSESGDVLLQLNVEAAHDEAKDCLQEQPGDLFIKNVTSRQHLQENGSAPWCTLGQDNRPRTLRQWFRACRTNCEDLSDRGMI